MQYITAQLIDEDNELCILANDLPRASAAAQAVMPGLRTDPEDDTDYIDLAFSELGYEPNYDDHGNLDCAHLDSYFVRKANKYDRGDVYRYYFDGKSVVREESETEWPEH